MGGATKKTIDDMTLRILEEINSEGVGQRNSKDIELSILTVTMETQRAILNELILIREKLGSE
jgi:hypothetical protein